MIIIYAIVACILASLGMEFFNRKTAESTTGHRLSIIVNAIKGWPAYAVNVVICAALALIACVLPWSIGFSFGTWALVTFGVYFGNSFVYNTFVRYLSQARAKLNQS